MVLDYTSDKKWTSISQLPIVGENKFSHGMATGSKIITPDEPIFPMSSGLMSFGNYSSGGYNSYISCSPCSSSSSSSFRTGSNTGISPR